MSMCPSEADEVTGVLSYTLLEIPFWAEFSYLSGNDIRHNWLQFLFFVWTGVVKSVNFTGEVLSLVETSQKDMNVMNSKLSTSMQRLLPLSLNIEICMSSLSDLFEQHTPEIHRALCSKIFVIKKSQSLMVSFLILSRKYCLRQQWLPFKGDKIVTKKSKLKQNQKSTHFKYRSVLHYVSCNKKQKYRRALNQNNLNCTM